MTIDATIGGTISNSYVTVSEANSYFESRNFASEWESITEPEQYLISATNQIDWFIKFKGSKVSTDQALMWPRNECYDSFLDEYVANDIIPKKIKHAVFELILSSLEEDRMQDSDMLGLQEIKVSSLKVVANSVGAWQPTKTKIPSIVYTILSGISESTSSMFSRAERF